MRSPNALNLSLAPLRRPHRVRALAAPDHAPEWKSWLEELGFLPGEHVSVLSHALPGRDPLVVRVGQSTYALRRAEAACVLLHEAGDEPGKGASHA
ncbi:ferrous iron transport protein A [Pelomonas sp. CA6]|uniref:FeoA family protein n=1 Tax=Pelomonas sp. CA6 TaxID=2907999 RepID=UPI001F4C494D|nr:FeoA family protein [Pelomonas sp. CA6]MCH7345822.1 ferrous iron transport protein A [Pelomonas sp. CA6]